MQLVIYPLFIVVCKVSVQVFEKTIFSKSRKMYIFTVFKELTKWLCQR